MAITPSQARTEAELVKLCHDWAFFLDYRFYDQFVSLFTPDGAFRRVMVTHNGRDEIRAGVAGRPDDVITRHVSSSFHFKHVSDTEVRGCVYTLSYAGRMSEARDAPLVQMEEPIFLDFHDRYVHTPDGWRFAERVSRALFVDPDSPMLNGSPRWKPYGRP